MISTNQERVLRTFRSSGGEAGATQFRTIRGLAGRAKISQASARMAVTQLMAKGLIRHPTKERMGLARRPGKASQFWMLNGERGRKALRQAEISE